MVNDCEVIDFVLNPDGSRVLRRVNEAANVELARRGGSDRWGATSLSGEVAPYAVEWVDTCGGYSWVVDGEPAPPDDSVLAADDFNRADGDPGPNWVLEDPTFIIASGRLIHTGGRDFIAWATVMPTADYYVQADVWGYGGPGDDTSQYVIVHGRANGFGDNSCYMGYIHPTSGNLVIGKLVGYAYSDVATAPYTRHAPPTRLRLAMQGTALRLYADGVLVVSATDSDITAAGQPGLNASSAGGAEHPPQFDNFAVVELTA